MCVTANEIAHVMAGFGAIFAFLCLLFRLYGGGAVHASIKNHLMPDSKAIKKTPLLRMGSNSFPT